MHNFCVLSFELVNVGPIDIGRIFRLKPAVFCLVTSKLTASCIRLVFSPGGNALVIGLLVTHLLGLGRKHGLVCVGSTENEFIHCVVAVTLLALLRSGPMVTPVNTGIAATFKSRPLLFFVTSENERSSDMTAVEKSTLFWLPFVSLILQQCHRLFGC
jgi:hypothetical protein